VTRSPAHAMPKTDRRRLLLLPTLRRFLRLSFRFSLLRHCCPPSLSGWRYRYSAVANRSALHPDYYTEKKITVTPLNFLCRRRRPRRSATRDNAIAAMPCAKIFDPQDFAINFSGIVKIPMTYGFLRHRVFQNRQQFLLASAPSSHMIAPAIRSATAAFARRKNYAPDASTGTLTTPHRAQNARISANRFDFTAPPGPRARRHCAHDSPSILVAR
jgi:hypothetical protein